MKKINWLFKRKRGVDSSEELNSRKIELLDKIKKSESITFVNKCELDAIESTIKKQELLNEAFLRYVKELKVRCIPIGHITYIYYYSPGDDVVFFMNHVDKKVAINIQFFRLLRDACGYFDESCVEYVISKLFNLQGYSFIFKFMK